MNKAKIEAKSRHCKHFSSSLVYCSRFNHFATSFSNFLKLYNLVKHAHSFKPHLKSLILESVVDSMIVNNTAFVNNMFSKY